MTTGGIDYGELMQAALKGVMRAALEIAAKEGLPDQHHFYITFKTNHPGVNVASHLKPQYAEEMTVVMQHQFENLEIDDEGFQVSLRFNRRPELLFIPFEAVTAFVDPAVNFALHFQQQDGDGSASFGDSTPQADRAEKTPGSDDDPGPDDGNDGAPSGSTVVSLDSFRNKK
jgi:hypothetical protein